MLVRALKVLRFFSKMRQPARTSTRQPLISRAMKVGLMAEEAPIGNDEPRHVPCPGRGAQHRGERTEAKKAARRVIRRAASNQTNSVYPNQRGASTITTWRPSKRASC